MSSIILKFVQFSIQQGYHLFANLASGKNINDVMKKIVFYEYRKKVFELIVFCSDAVVKTHNSISIISYEAEKTGNKIPRQ